MGGSVDPRRKTGVDSFNKSGSIKNNPAKDNRL